MLQKSKLEEFPMSQKNFPAPNFSIKLFLFVWLVFFSAQVMANNTPDVIIRQMSEAFEKDLVAQQDNIKENPQLTKELITRHILPNINFLLMSRYVLGKNWNKASEEERERFVDLFTRLLVHFYSKGFNEVIHKYQLSTGMISYLPFRSKKGARFVRVKTRVKLQADKPAIRIDYSLYQSKKHGWKIYDINIEGVSLVTSYRSSFNQIIQKHQMSGLLKHLQDKIDKFKS